MREYITKEQALRRFADFGHKIPKVKEEVACDIWGGIWIENGFCSCGERSEYCEHAKNPSGDIWECDCFLNTYCEHQIYDRDPDGTLNIVKCGERSEE